MRKRELADGIAGPRLKEALFQTFCMKGMSTTEKVEFLSSRNRELRAENHRLQAENDRLCVELTDLRLKSCPSCGIKVENEKLRELVAHLWSVRFRATHGRAGGEGGTMSEYIVMVLSLWHGVL